MGHLFVQAVIACAIGVTAYAADQAAMQNVYSDTIPRQYTTTSRLQIGDLLIDIPRGQKFRAELDSKYHRFDYSTVPTYDDATKVDLISFSIQDAWAMSGTHKNAVGYEHTFLIITLLANVLAPGLDDWCTQPSLGPAGPGRNYDISHASAKAEGFYIFGQRLTKVWNEVWIPVVNDPVFNSPLAFDVSRPSRDSNSLMYFTTITVTPYTQLLITFSNDDLTDATPQDIVRNVSANIAEWLRSTPHLSDIMYHKPNDTCPR